MKHDVRRNHPSKQTRARGRVGLVESFERRMLLAIDVPVGVGADARSVTFTDADGTAAVIRVAGGAATVTFDGTNLASAPSGTAVTVTGTNVVMTNLVITGPNPNVTVTTAGGDGSVTLGGMSAAGPVNGFRGPGVVLGGTTTLANGIGRLDLGGTQGATINITRGGQARLQDAAVNIGTAQDTSISSQQPLSQLRVGSWTAGVPGQPDGITTPRINTIQSAGDFAASISLSGNGQAVGRPILGNVRVAGALAGGTWDVDGRASRVAAGSVAPGWAGVFGDVSSFAVTNDFAGTLTADSINALSAGSITNADITLNRPSTPRATALNRLAVRGAIAGTDVRATADIGSVSAASITGSTIYAGLTAPGGALPSVPPAGDTTIKNVTITSRGSTPAFVDSNIAARTLGRISLGVVQVSNAGEPFGLAALSLRALSAVGAAGAPIREANLTDQADSFVQSDFAVRIF